MRYIASKVYFTGPGYGALSPEDIYHYPVYAEAERESQSLASQLAQAHFLLAPVRADYTVRRQGPIEMIPIKSEDLDPDFLLPYTDHQARLYSSMLSRWMVPDPLSEKYYGISPYAYCGGNPMGGGGG